MGESASNVEKDWDMDWRMPLCRPWNNCQDYTDAVRDEYDRLLREESNRRWYLDEDGNGIPDVAEKKNK